MVPEADVEAPRQMLTDSIQVKNIRWKKKQSSHGQRSKRSRREEWESYKPSDELGSEMFRETGRIGSVVWVGARRCGGQSSFQKFGHGLKEEQWKHERVGGNGGIKRKLGLDRKTIACWQVECKGLAKKGYISKCEWGWGGGQLIDSAVFQDGKGD